MTSFFKGLALFIALASLVWLGVLWHWQSTQYEMSASDVVVYLVALPLVVFVLVLLARWAWRGAAQKAAAGAGAAPAAAAADATSAAAAPAADAPARHVTWQLLTAHARTVAGATVADCLGAAEAGKPAPALEPTLRDRDGLPVVCAKVAGLDVDELQAALQALGPSEATGGGSHPALSASLTRGLALLRDPLWAAVAELAPWAQALGGVAPSADLGAAPASAAAAAGAHESLVHVLVAWPAGLAAHEQALALRWLSEQLQQAGKGVVAPRRWLIAPAAAPAACSGPQLWLQADALFEAMRRDARQDALLLLAAHSDIGSDTIEALQAEAALFSSRQPKGVIPGEAAVALLLAPAEWPADPDAGKPKPHLQRAAAGQRDKSIDAPGRTSHELIQKLSQQALQAARLPAAAIAGVASDADQHTPRAAELFAAMLAELPHLEAKEDLRMWGPVGGHTGACGTLLAVAMAARQAVQANKPCLALSLGDARWRAALVVHPEAPPALNPAEAAAARAA